MYEDTSCNTDVATELILKMSWCLKPFFCCIKYTADFITCIASAPTTISNVHFKRSDLPEKRDYTSPDSTLRLLYILLLQPNEFLSCTFLNNCCNVGLPAGVAVPAENQHAMQIKASSCHLVSLLPTCGHA